MSPDARRVGALALLAFLVLASYAAARPASESLFLEVHGSARLPLVWLAVAAAATAAAAIFRRAVGRTSLPRLFVRTIAIEAAILVALLLVRPAWRSGATFLLYCWKDVYVVLLVELVWSIANAIFDTRVARWAYGLICVAGSLGGIAANLGVGRLSQAVGSGTALWTVPPLLGLTALAVRATTPVLAVPDRPAPAPAAPDRASLRSASRYVLLLLALVATVQVAVTLVDYQFNATVEASLRDTDARTAFIGRVYAAIDAGSTVLQLATGAILRALGVRATLAAIPLVLGTALGAFLAGPSVLTIAIAKVGGKAFDYSVFRAAKEILYLPLEYREKTQGKALVDVFGYRVSKAGASLLIAALVALGAPVSAATVALALVALWLGLTIGIGRRYHRLVSSEESRP